MKILNTYRMRTPTRVLDLAPGADLEAFAQGERYELTPTLRLVAEEGMALTDGARTQGCVIAESAQGWREVPDPQKGRPE